MRPYQIFAAMKPEQARALLDASRRAPIAWAQVLGLTAGSLKARPMFVQKQPPSAARSGCARRCRGSLRIPSPRRCSPSTSSSAERGARDWLPDRRGAREGLADRRAEEPAAKKLGEAVEGFRKAAGDDADAADRELLLRAFAAQSSIEWPGLDALLAPSAAAGA